MTPGKLLIEVADVNELEYLVENVTEKEKSYKIKGPFMRADSRNRNGRIYPRKILESEVARYDREFVKTKRAISSLDHPLQSTVQLADACHLITELRMDGDVVYGTAKILDTPQGRIAKTLMNEGIQLAISSRGVGGLSTESVVCDNFRLLALDLVQNPSESLAFVESIMESQDYIIRDNKLVAVNMEEFKKNLSKNGTRNLYNDLNKFLTNLSRKL